MSVFDSDWTPTAIIIACVVVAVASSGFVAVKAFRDAVVRPVSVQRHIDNELGVACYWGTGTQVLSCVRLRGVE